MAKKLSHSAVIKLAQSCATYGEFRRKLAERLDYTGFDSRSASRHGKHIAGEVMFWPNLIYFYKDTFFLPYESRRNNQKVASAIIGLPGITFFEMRPGCAFFSVDYDKNIEPWQLPGFEYKEKQRQLGR